MKDFDKLFDLSGLKEDIANAKDSEYQDIPVGDYEVKVEKMELVESKKGDPMVSIWFKIVAGDFKEQMIFYNQVITQGFQIHLNNEFLNSFNSGCLVEFNTYAQYAQLLSDIYVAVDGTYEYLLSYGQTKKGYSSYKIKDVYNVAQG